MESRRRVHRTNHRHALRFANGRTAQQKGADETEHGGVHGDAQRQREHRSDGESRAFEQTTHGVMQIAEQGIESGQRARLAMLQPRLFPSAEANQRLTACFAGSQSALDIFFDG